MPHILIEGIRLFYRKCGRGPNLIFIPGLFLDSGCYSGLIERLKLRFTVYALDLPSHGKSSLVKEPMSMLHLDILIHQFIREEAIQDPVIMGHSTGGLISLHYASKYQAKKVWLLNPVGGGILSYLHIINAIFFHKPINSFMINPKNTIKICRTGLLNICRNLFNKEVWKLFFEIKNYDFISSEDTVATPIIIIWGYNDILLHIKHLDLFRHEGIEIITHDGTHDWPILQPHKINKMIYK